MQKSGVAVVGLSCRFPGADNCEQFWDNLINGVDSVKKIPETRWNASEKTPQSQWVGLVDDVDSLDCRLFKISPADAELMDPQQKMLLQTVWHCIEDSGIPLQELQSKRTAVYISYFTSDHRNILVRAETKPSAAAMLGNCDSCIANRISFIFNFTGESLSVNTACAGGLVAIHHAKKALLSGECDYAVAGGVNLNIDVWKYECLGEGHMLSADGRCKAFSIDANGYVPGDGAAALLLQRPDDALSQNRSIYGEIIGSSVNHTGNSHSITAPKIERQCDVIMGALDNAGISPEKLTYLEAHGTGTSLGDPIEVEALRKAFSHYTDRLQFCGLGSVKANIGHLEAAAGLAGLIKVLMMFRYRMIPPSINISETNPIINFEETPFVIYDSPAPIRENGEIYAGISSFGFSGSNAHIIVKSSSQSMRGSAAAADEFMLSARSREALTGLIDAWKSFADSSAAAEYSFSDICRTLQCSRNQFRYRFFAKAASLSELKNALYAGKISDVQQDGFDVDICIPKFKGYRDIDRLFTPFPFLDEECTDIFKACFGSKYSDSLNDFRSAVWNEKQLKVWNMVSGLLLTAALKKSGIRIDRFRNTDSDPTLCLAAAGFYSPEQAVLKALCSDGNIESGRVTAEAEFGNTMLYPYMLIDEGSAEELCNEIISAFANAEPYTVSKINAFLDKCRKLYPHQFTLKKLLDQWFGDLRSNGFETDLQSDHSETDPKGMFCLFLACVDSMIAVYKKWGLDFSERFDDPKIDAFVSILRSRSLSRQELLRCFVMCRYSGIEMHIFNTDGLTEVLKKYCRIPCERTSEFTAVPRKQESLYFDPDITAYDSLMNVLCEAWNRGSAVEWHTLFKGADYRTCHLPVYEFDGGSRTSKPNISENNDNALPPNEAISMHRMLSDHIISGNAVLPAAFYPAYIMGSDKRSVGLSNLAFLKMFSLSDPVKLNIKIKSSHTGKNKFEFISEENELYAIAEEAENSPLNEKKAVCPSDPAESVMDGAEHYRIMHSMGYGYGSSFRMIKSLAFRKGSVFAEFGNISENSFDGSVAVIDGVLQAAIMLGLRSGGFNETVLPYRIGKAFLTDRISRSTAVLITESGNGTFDASVFENGSVTAELCGIRFGRSRQVRLYRPVWLKSDAGDPIFPDAVFADDLSAGLLRRSGINAADLSEISREALSAENIRIVISANKRPPCEVMEKILTALKNADRRQKNKHCICFDFLSCSAEECEAYGAAVRSAEAELSRYRFISRYHSLCEDERVLADELRSFCADIPSHSCSEQIFKDGQLYIRAVSDCGYGTEKILRQGGCYVITGGLGGIGRKLAEYLAYSYKAKLILIGRRSLDVKTSEWLSALDEGALSAEYIVCDVSDADDMDRLIKAVPKADGIFHCAGIIDDCLIENKTIESVKRVLAPKVYGTQNLYKLAQESGSGFLMLFSSVVSAWGNYGQCDYAMANRYMDTFAAANNSDRLRVVSVNWPLWSDGGMTIGAEYAEQMERAYGISEISSAQAFSVLNGILSSPYECVMAALPSDRFVTGKFCGEHISENEYRMEINKMNSKRTIDSSYIADVIVETAAQILKIQKSEISSDESMADYGFESVTISEFSNRLSSKLNIALTPTAFFENDTFCDLAESIITDYADVLEIPHAAVKEPTVRDTAKHDTDVQVSQAPVHHAEVTLQQNEMNKNLGCHNEDAAIIGLSCRFPMADNVSEFYDNLLNGRDCISSVPKERWDTEAFRDGSSTSEYKTEITRAGMCSGFDMFDPAFWNISKKEACEMDPQQRIVLDEVIKAAEDAGCQLSELSKQETGVFVAATTADYSYLTARNRSRISAKSMLNTFHCIIANRISYIFDFKGPSEAVDAACAGSLVALHRAVQALKNNECSYAFVIGVNVFAAADTFISFDKSGMLSRSFRSNTFDAAADGYARGEGVGVILLTLSDRAAAAGNVYAYIKGTAVGHCGRTSGITVPDPNEQAKVIYRAWKQAGVSPDKISMIETHGTGTPLGDPIEVRGLAKAFRSLAEDHGTELRGGSCGLGAVKADIGHLEAASGIAGIIKICCQMKHRKLLSVNHFKKLNPYISFEKTPFYVISENKEWSAPVMYAGVSSFGFGGVNAHAALASAEKKRASEEFGENEMLFVYSAKNETDLTELINAQLPVVGALASREQLQAYSYNLKLHKQAYNIRAAVTADSIDSLYERIKGFASGQRDGWTTGNAEHSVLKDFMDCSDGYRIIEEDIINRRQQRLACAWVNGLAIDWRKYYSGCVFERIDLPDYPHKYIRCWMDDIPVQMAADSKNRSVRINRTIVLNGSDRCFSDHVVGGRMVVPAAFYVDAVIAMIRDEEPSLHIRLEKVIFRNMCFADKNEFALCCNAELTEGKGSFTVSSDNGTVMCSGNIAVSERLSSDIPCYISDTFGRKIDTDELYDIFSGNGIDYLEAYRRIGSVSANADSSFQTITETHISGDGFSGSAEITAIDAGMQAALYLNDSEGCCVPFSMDGAEIFASPAEIASSVVKRTADGRFDIYFYDRNGAAVCLISGMRLQRTELNEYKLLRPVWKSYDGVLSSNAAVDGAVCFIVPSELGGMASEIRMAMPSAEVIGYNSADCGALSVKYKTIFFVGVDAELAEGNFENGQHLIFDYFRLFRKLFAENNALSADKVYLMLEKRDELNSVNAALKGFFLSVSKEYPAVSMAVFELEGGAVRENILCMNRLINSHPHGKNVFTVSDGRPEIQLLEEITCPSADGFEWAADKTIVIAGCGGIGVLTAQMLSEKYRANVILLGRRPSYNGTLPDERVSYMSCDITDKAAVSRVFSDITSEYGHIEAVIHAAMVLNDSALSNMTDKMFSDTLCPKTYGIRNLFDVCEDNGIRRMIIFSSAQSYLNYAGQSNYSAASTFIDSYSAERGRESGISVKVINWGLWGAVGAVSDNYHQKRMQSKGLRPFMKEDGLAAMNAAMAAEPAAVTAVKINSEDICRVFNSYGFDNIEDAVPTAASELEGYLNKHIIAPDRIAAITSCKQELERMSADYAAEAVARLDREKMAAADKKYPMLMHELKKLYSKSTGSFDGHSSESLGRYSELLRLIRNEYADILSSELNAVSVLFGTKCKDAVSDIYKNNIISDYYNKIVTGVLQYSMVHKLRDNGGKCLRILEIGGGTGGTTDCVLSGIRPLMNKWSYCFTDVSKSFLVSASERYKQYSGMEYELLDISEPLEKQGFGDKQYDYIIATNVMHAVADIDSALENACRLLSDDGMLILNELTEKNAFYTVIFGLLDGWWLNAADPRRIEGSPLFSVEGWKKLLASRGFENISSFGDGNGSVSNGQNVIVCKKKVVSDAGTEKNDTDIRRKILDILSECLGEPVKKTDESFENIGVDSIISIEFTEKVNKALQIKCKATDVFNYVSPEGFINYCSRLSKGGHG